MEEWFSLILWIIFDFGTKSEFLTVLHLFDSYPPKKSPCNPIVQHLWCILHNTEYNLTIVYSEKLTSFKKKITISKNKYY